jgi:protein-L-isoaspartate O-methyltransferase
LPVVGGLRFRRSRPPLVSQLHSGARLVQPVGRGGQETVVLFERRSQGLKRVRSLTSVSSVGHVAATCARCIVKTTNPVPED